MFQKILIAIDLNDPEGAAKVASHGSQLAQMCGSELHVMTVVPSMGMNLVGSAFGPEHVQRMIDDSAASLKSWAAEVLPKELVTKVHVAQGRVYDQILKTATAIETDMIVVGAHSPELRDYLVGPNAARVVRHAKQTVLVVR